MKNRTEWISRHWTVSGASFLLLGMLLLCCLIAPPTALAEDETEDAILDPTHEDYFPSSPDNDVIIEPYGDSEIFETDKPRGDLRRRRKPTHKTSTCGQGNDCSLRPSEDVVLAVTLPTSRYWSFSLCGSSFDTYMAVGSTPCSADLGFNDDFCGTQSRTECIYLEAGTVFVTIEGNSMECGSYTVRVDSCVPGRCCYIDLSGEVACKNTGIDECFDVGGEWDETLRCETTPCPVGRCCYEEDGVSYCLNRTLQKDCLFSFQGEWTAGETCDDECDEFSDSSGCGPIDLVLMIDISGSMVDEINDVRQGAEEILEAAIRIAGSDLRASTIGFREYVQVFSPLTADIGAVAATFGQMTAAGGGSPGEASDEALREVITRDGGSCVVGDGFSVPFRNNASKVVILITDELNSGCNQVFSPAYAHQRALDAAAAGIHISPIYITNMLNNPDIETVLQDYAAMTNGLLVHSPRGENIADKIKTIINQCGQLGLALAPSHVPELTCEDGVSPTTFDIEVNVYNQADITIGTGSVGLVGLPGSGGSGVVVSESPQFVGLVEPGDTVAVPFTVTIEPDAVGGCINFEAYLIVEGDTISTQTVCIEIPVVSLTMGAHSIPMISCGEAGISPTTFDVSFVVRNPSTCATSAGIVAMGPGSGHGGQGTIVSSHSIGTGLIESGGSTTVHFMVDISPYSQGGCITFPVYLILFGDTLYTRSICVEVPPVNLAFTAHAVPHLTCDDGVISPSTFDIALTVRNTSDCATDAGRVALRSGNGPGGTGSVNSQNPYPLGLILPGDSAVSHHTVSIATTNWGGCITFTAYVIMETDTIAARLVCVNVPQVRVQFAGYDAPTLTCTDEGLIPRNSELSVTVMNPSDCSTSRAEVYLSGGSGPGGLGLVLSLNPALLDLILPGDSVSVPFDLNIFPTASGGCVTFRAKLVLGGDTVSTQNICLTVPTYGGQVISSTIGDLNCDGESLASTEVGVDIVSGNTSECTIPGGVLRLSSGSGPGGIGIVLSSDSIVIPALEPGEETSTPFTLGVSPQARGGHVTFTASFMIDEDTVSSQDISLAIPACGCESSAPIRYTFNTVYHNCFCVHLCDTVPIPISFCRTSGAPGFRPAIIESGTCGSDCAEGEALVVYGDWLRVGNCWTNVIIPVYQGCVRLCVDIYLPVELMTFEATPGFDRIDLYWMTASESEIDHFELLRNGTLLSQIPAQNLATGSDYSFADYDVREGMIYTYQLISVDFGGERTELAEVSSSPLGLPLVISNYALLPNFPNPFNGSTTIEFDLPDAADVQLVVYDVSGRKVRELARGLYSAGRHAVVFSGDDLASGLYFCHMIAGEYSTRQKMLHLK